MGTIRKVLAATDFSAGAAQATERAAQLAAEHHATLTLLHVVEPDAFLALRDFVTGDDLHARVEEQGRMQLAALAEALERRHGVSVDTLLRPGRPLEELSAAAADADILVLGAQGSHPIRQFALGPTADRLSRLTDRPLLVTRSEPVTGYRRVMVGIDFSEPSRDALEQAMRLAPDASLDLVHCFDMPFEGRVRLAGVAESQIDACRTQTHARAMEQLKALVAQTNTHARANAIVRRGDARIELLRAATEQGADLIVLGKHGQSMVADALLGSVTSWTLREATCDVLVVPAKPAAE